MSRNIRRCGMGLVLILGLASMACSTGPTLYPVKGKVTVKGQNAVGAVVMFFPEGTNASPSTGVCGEDGTFTLTTGTGEGAPAGNYIVAINWPDPKVKITDSQKMMGNAPDRPDVLAGAYSKEKSTLKATVKAETNNLAPFAIN